MIISTTNKIPNKDKPIKRVISLINAAYSESINSYNMMNYDLKSSTLGGEIESVTLAINIASIKARDALKKECERVGGNAIVCFRYETVVLNKLNISVLAYGTAVEI